MPRPNSGGRGRRPLARRHAHPDHEDLQPLRCRKPV